MKDSVRDPAFEKLENILGRERASEVWASELQLLGVADLDEPGDRLRFGQALVRHGGILEAIGRSIKVQAVLRGAVDER
jgi:hypothetical protein